MPPFSLPSTLHSLINSLSLAAAAGGGAAASLPIVRRAHCRAILLGLHRHPLLAAKLITAYSLLGLPSLSHVVFSSLSSTPSTALFNALLSAFSRCALPGRALTLFTRMRAAHPPDNYTLSILSKAAADLANPATGRALHALAIKLGFLSDTILCNSLMVMYLQCGIPKDARLVFDEMLVKSVASWNAVISECAAVGDWVAVLELVGRMQMEGMKPDAFTICNVLRSCGVDSGGLMCGRGVHGFVVRHGLGLDFDFHVGSCLISMYSSGGRVEMGRRVFDLMASKNVVAWTAMITGYVEDRGFEEALVLFRKMQLSDRIVPNKITLVSILPAVGSLAGLLEGKQIHAFAIRADLSGEVSLNNALINMYSKCGSLGSARRVFDDESWHKDAISWSSMISGYGIHGRGEKAVSLFSRMCCLGIKSDHITSVVVLSACGRAGLVSEGLEIYNSLVEGFGVLPSAEMCSCMVDMLARAGRLKQALDFINSMPVKPGPNVWGALFGASLIHNDQEMQELAYRSLLQSEPENPSNYVSASNLHASSGRWDFVAEVRTRMKERGLKKMPGYSWVNVESRVHSFYVADKSHQCSETIYALLDHLLLAMKETGHVPDFDSLICTSV